MINENIKKYRKQKGMSQEEMAVRLNVVRQTVSKWESGVSHSKRYYINYNNAALILYLL